MTNLTNQIITILTEQLIAVAVIAVTVFLLGLIFEKPLMALAQRTIKYYEKKKAEKLKKEYIAIKLQKEADRRKVQKIRDNFNKELENTGTICVPYYAVS